MSTSGLGNLWEISVYKLKDWFEKNNVEKGRVAVSLLLKYGINIDNNSLLLKSIQLDGVNYTLRNITPKTAIEVIKNIICKERRIQASKLALQDLNDLDDLNICIYYDDDDCEKEGQEVNSQLLDEKYVLRMQIANDNKAFLDNIYYIQDNKWSSNIKDEHLKLVQEKIKKYYQFSLWTNVPQNKEIVQWNQPQYLLMNIDIDRYERFTEEQKSLIQTPLNTIIDSTHAQNIIFYGAPGTGKSYGIQSYIANEMGIDKEALNLKEASNVFRTTFHPEYGYSDFVGQVMPRVKDENLLYEFIPGIFTVALQYAIEHPDELTFLVLEEMSRANCAAVFGDIFQLLDRDKDGCSEYAINNRQVADYIYNNEKVKISLPNNLYIIGTMNTSDQNVYTMDTAFKRRFLMKYVPTTIDQDKNQFEIPFNHGQDKTIAWNTFVEKTNEYIVSKDGLNLGEDKQMGQFFMKGYDGDDKDDHDGSFKVEDEVVEYKVSHRNNYETYRDKVLYYLYNDVEKASYSNENTLFDLEKINSFGELYEKVSNRDFDIYSEQFMDKFNDLEGKSDES